MPLTLQMPPRLSSPPASKMVTSKPWPTQCAADVTPVIPAPIIATFGLRNGLLLSGGAGDRILSVRYWKIWNQKRKGWNKGFSTLDSEGMLRSSRGWNSGLRLGGMLTRLAKGQRRCFAVQLQLYTGGSTTVHRHMSSISNGHPTSTLACDCRTIGKRQLQLSCRPSQHGALPILEFRSEGHDVICRGA